MGFGAPPGVTKHTELTDKEVAAIIDHADLSVSDAKLASGVGLTDGQICKLPTAVADQILIRGATAWEPGAVPAAAIEGDYSIWTKIWEYSFSEGLNYLYFLWAAFAADYLCVHYEDDASPDKRRFAVIDLSDGSNKFISPSGEHYTEDISRHDLGFTYYNQIVNIYYYSAMSFSVFGKYLLIGRDGAALFEVWKDGVKVWTSPLASEAVAGATYYYGAGIRYDGKYIVALTSNKKLVCFEGS